MNSLKHIIYNIRTLIKDRHSDDLKFTDRNIAYWVTYLRTKLIRQDIDKGREISDNIIQKISVDLESVDKGSSVNTEIKEYQVKSKQKLPRFLSVAKGDLVLTIGSKVDDSFFITLQPKSKATKNCYNKYGKKYPVAYLDNGYLYIKGCNFYIENVLIHGVFQDPEEVEKFNNPDYTLDDYYNKEFPIEQHMIDMINSIIKSNELNLYFQLEEDKTNNAQNNSL